MLDIKINTFLTVCEYMNYTKASEVLHMTQPAVSKQIQQLEEYYQVKLFEYKNRRLSLTTEGEFLMYRMSAMHQDAIRVRQNIGKTIPRHRLRIGATLSIGNYSLVHRINRLIQKYPEIDISLTVSDTKILLEHLDQGNLDFIFCEGNFPKSRYEYQLIRSVPLVILCGKDYEHENVKRIEDLFSHTLILREQGSGTREIFENYLKISGYSIQDFHNYHEFNNAEVILKILEANQGISVLYEEVGEERLREGRLQKIDLEGFHLVHDFNIVWNKSSYSSEYYKNWIDIIMNV